MSEQNNRKNLQDCFPISHTYIDHQNPENMGESHTNPVQLFLAPLVKTHGENSVHKDQRLPMNLNGLN